MNGVRSAGSSIMSHIPIIGGGSAKAGAGNQQEHNAADSNQGEHHDENDDATPEGDEQTGEEEAQEEAKDEEHSEHKSAQ